MKAHNARQAVRAQHGHIRNHLLRCSGLSRKLCQGWRIGGEGEAKFSCLALQVLQFPVSGGINS